MSVRAEIEKALDGLKRLRVHRGWSQERLAQELGVSYVTINRWENRKNEPSQMACKLIVLLVRGKVR